MRKLTTRLTAMLLSGMLVIGSVPGAVFAADADAGQTSEYAQEVYTEGEIAEESSEDTEEEAAAASEENVADTSEETAVQYYTVTLDANGGYFENELDDAAGEIVEQAEVVEKQIPVGGTVAVVPVFVDPDGQTMLFTGWSLERDGELVITGDEEYAPVDNCVLYAMWEAAEVEDAGLADTEQETEAGCEDTETEEAAQESEDAQTGESAQEDENTEAAEDTGTAQEIAEDEYTAPETDNEQDTDTTPAREVIYSDEEEISEESSDASIVEASEEDEETVREDAAMGVVASGKCGTNLTWSLDDAGTLTISGTGKMNDYASNSCVFKNYEIETVVIDNGVSSIGRYAFYNCKGLTSVTIPNSMTSIGSWAFYFCNGLSSVTIPNSVTSIGGYAFEYCSGLTSVTIPNNLTSIDAGAFQYCSSLTSVTIPNGVTSIGSDAFHGCSGLTSVIIPNSVTSIGNYAFEDCSGLTSITIPNSVTSIGGAVFSGCRGLSSITIPNSVTSIGYNAFHYCSSLNNIFVESENPAYCSLEGVLYNKDQTEMISFPSGRGSHYSIPDSVTSIGNGAFSDCVGLTSVTISSSVTSIGNSAFFGCRGLTSVTIPNSVTSIGDYVFQYCSSLTSVTIPNEVTSIGNATFVDCTSLSEIYFNGNAPTISSGAFYNVTATAYYPANDPTWTEDVRQNYGGNITWVEWDPTSSGEDEKLKIVSTTPTNGDLNVDHALDYFSIQFNEYIAYGNEGYAYLYDASNGSSPVARALIGLGDEEHNNDQSSITSGNTLEIHFPFDVELGHEYYIKIDADCIKKDTSDINEEGEATEEVYFKGITDNQSWRFKICAVDYMHFGNPTDPIHDSVYHVLFTPIKASFIKMFDNGSKGTCFGWSYAVGAKASGYDGINGFGKELKSLEKNSLYGTTDFSFLEYIQYAQLYQDTFEKIMEKDRTENKYNDIFNAIKASVNGTGPKIVVNVYGKGGHTVYPLSILEENDSEVQIRVINPNEDFVTGAHYSTLTLKKKDGVINGFEMEGYNKRISYSTVDEVIDDVFYLASEYISDTNMIHSSVSISDSDYYELEPCGNDETNIQDMHLYWYDGTQVNTSLSSDNQIGITDGYKDICVTVGDNADINLNLDEMSAVVESSSDIPSEYEISYKEAISADRIETITVSSSTAGELIGQKTSEGIVVQSSGSEDINVYTDDLSIKASTNGDSVLIKADNNNGIEVLKDPDGDGEYDEQVPVEILSENRIQIVESMVSGIQGKKYTGKEIKQEIILTNENTVLTEGTDYEVSYTNNTNIGTATVTITGKGNYTGSVSKTFTISAASIANATVSGISNKTYTGSALTQNPTVKVGEQTLTKDTDYTVSYTNNTKVGTATVKITGKGNYTGTVSKTYKINGIPVSNATVSGISNKTYTGSALTQNPTVKAGDKTLKKGTDYTISYANNTNVGTATVTITGKGNYASKKTATFKINKAAQSITAKARASRVAVGKTTTVSITGNKGKKSYKSSNTAIATVTSAGKVTAKKVGTVKITATSAATSNYNAASKTVTIKIVPAATASLTAANQATGIKLTWKKVTGANGYKVYRGSTLIKTITSGSTVTFADTKANTNGTKYTYKVVAKATTGDSTLSKSRVIYRVSRPAVSSVTNSASKKMTVKWGKNAKATGYQIQYSTDKNFKSGNKAVTVASVSTVSRVIGSLTKGKTYYVRIRTYKTVGSAKYWSIWSAARSVKISK